MGTTEDRRHSSLRRDVDREILALALPSLGSLIAEPLLLAADTAMVGHLGTAELAALGLASTILSALWGVFIFLTYTTTAAASRALGAGDQRGALRLGVSGLWLGALIGGVLAVVLLAGADPVVAALGGRGEVAAHAALYLRCSAPGLVGLLVVLAGTGTLRGLMDARTPLLITIGGGVANVALNATLMYGVGLGIAGAGLGTALSQTGMAAVLVSLVAREARRLGVPLRPTGAEVGSTWRAGVPLFVRTVALRACLVVTVVAATRLGEVPLAAHQVVATVYTFFSYPAESLGIAGQSLVGHALGAKDRDRVRAVVVRSVLWAVVLSVVSGVVLVAARGVICGWFTESATVAEATSQALVLVAVFMPVSGIVFCLDGVLIGAGRARFLAVGATLTLLAHAPVVATVGAWGPRVAWLVPAGASAEAGAAGGLVAAIWASYMLLFLGVRAVTNGWDTRRLLDGR